MTNADDFCQYARFGQTVKIQKCLQSRSIDINALNLYGESALSTATYYNQILCVEYLLANKADPKLRLSAGHTAIHVACRLANVPILDMLLEIKNEENDSHLDDRHLYQCLKIKDNSNLTPIHWAATQESVSKRQKIFAYLDQRMPGVLDSRYDPSWFHSWAKTHPWVIEEKAFTSPKPIDQSSRQEDSSEIISLDITPKTSNNDYERTPRAPLTSTTNQSKPRVQIESPSILPPTPISSCKVTVTSIYHIPKRDHKYDLSDPFTHRAHRVHIGPTIDFPPPPTTDPPDSISNSHDYEDMITSFSNKRPSHNLLSNIVPSIATPSTDQSSQQSTKHIASSFGFNTSHDPISTEQEESISTNDDDDYGSHQMDYICKSTSTLGMASPDIQTFYS